MRTNPRKRLSPAVVNRVVLIDEALRQFGSRVFYYSPKHIRSLSDRVPGYEIEGDQFVATTARVPRVNGNWTYNTRRLLNQGMGYQQFMDLADTGRISIYVPLAFSELVANKYEAYRLVRSFSDDLQPHTELYRQSASQLTHFLDRGGLVFIKPRAGNKGDGIITLRHNASGLKLSHYGGGDRQLEKLKNVAAAQARIRELTQNSRRFVIQHGVETLLHEDSVFDLRVVMIYDGSTWSWTHEARCSARGSELSNVSQGGSCMLTADLLHALLGHDSGDRVLEALRSESFALAIFLERLHPGDLMEIAFDFVLDRSESLRLVEINTKPGLADVGFSHSIFDMNDELEPRFQKWVYPHTTALAHFLQSKLDAVS